MKRPRARVKTRGSSTPDAAVQPVPPTLLLLCLLLRSSWLTREGSRHGHRPPDASPGRTGSLAVSVGVGSWGSNSGSLASVVADFPVLAAEQRSAADDEMADPPSKAEAALRLQGRRGPPGELTPSS